jgi:tetratricopeptide (TPR) repeat protein
VSSDQAKEFRRQGIAAAKAGQKEQARQLLQQSIKLEPRNEVAWLWLVNLAGDQRERLFYLNRLLEINPLNEMGQQALQKLGMSREQLSQQISSLPARQNQPDSAAVDPQAPGVPIPDEQRLTRLQPELEAIIQDYLKPPQPIPGVNWVSKKRGRVGENDVWVVRGYIAGGITAVLVALLIIGAIVVWNVPALRSLVFVPTPTASNTRPPPTLTYTPTPGNTPTPSPTPRLTSTPTPTLPPGFPNGALVGVEPTEIFPPAFEKGVLDSIALIDGGKYVAAIPTLAVEITRVASSFDPAPYYYEAMAQIRKGDLDAAKETLLDAEERLPEKPTENYGPIVNSALAYVNLLLGEQALKAGEVQQSTTLLSDAEDQANAAIEGDHTTQLAYLVLARRFILANEYDSALKALDDGLAVPQLASNVELLTERANVYLQQGEYPQAEYQAYMALYANPYTERAHQIRIQAAMEQGNPGLAVLYSQAYLFYYPGNAQGYKLLGDARAAEGKGDLALQAYNQALEGGDVVELLVARAKQYTSEHRYKEALDDLTRAFNASDDDPAIQAQRMQVAYQAKDYQIVQSDAEALLGKDIVSDDEIKLLQARSLIDPAEGEDRETFRDALGILNDIGNTLPAELQPVESEYRARANYNLRSYANALQAIDEALKAGDTGTRHYLRGLILEAQGKRDAALREYDWVLTWSEIYVYDFLSDVQERVGKLTD